MRRRLPSCLPLSRAARPRALALLLAVAVGAALAPAGAVHAQVSTAVAASGEVVARPANGVFTVRGHGWGHGHGLSQWGAQGAASLGRSAEQIVSFYYPGTSRAVLPNTPIRVLLSGDDGTDTQVFAAPGLAVTDVASGRRTALPSGPTRWRIVPTATGMRLDGLSGSSWTPAPIPTPTSTSDLRFSGPPVVRVAFPNGTSRDYRGSVQAVRVSSTKLRTVVSLGLEEYLLGVVPRESSPSWRPAALQAQAIAARSYSAYKRAHATGGGYDICDTTACQVFGGTALYSASGTRTAMEFETTTAAVRASAGVVRTLGGKPIFAEFSSSNGGWASDGGISYLRAQRDDWDGALPNPVHSWTASLPAADLERRYPAVGRLLRVRVTQRDGNGEWGGRVKAVVLEGVDSSGRATSVSTTGAGVYNARTWPASRDGLRSSWWSLGGAPPSPPPPSPPPPPPAPPAVLTASYARAPQSIVTGGAVPPVSADGRTVVVPRAGSTTVRLTLRNTGTLAWPVGPSSPVMMGTSVPRNRASTTAGAGWASPTRPARLLRAVDGGTSVPPGASGIFDVVLSGNGRPVGVTSEGFEPLWAGRGWIEGAARTLDVVRVDPAVPHAAAVHAAPPRELALRGRSTVVVQLVNHGGAAWQVGVERLSTLDGGPFGLSRGWSRPSTPPALAANLVRPGARTVEPGEVGEWRVPVSDAGRPAGTYELRLSAGPVRGHYGPVVSTRISTAGAGARDPRALYKGSGPWVRRGR